MSRRASPRLGPAAIDSEEQIAAAAAAPKHPTRHSQPDGLPSAVSERSRRTPTPAARLNDPNFLSGAAASRPGSAAAAASSVSSSAGVAATSAKQSSPRLAMTGSARGKGLVAAATKHKQPHAPQTTPHSPNVNGTLALQSQIQQQHPASEPQLSSPSRSTASPRRPVGFGKQRDLLVGSASKAARSVGLDSRVFPLAFQEAVSGAAAPPIHAPFAMAAAPPSPLRPPTAAAAAAFGSPPRVITAPPLAQSSRSRNKQQHTPAHQSADGAPSLLSTLHGHSFAAPAAVEPAVVAPPPSLAQAAADAAASAAPLPSPQPPQRLIPTLPAQPAAASFPLHATRHSAAIIDPQPAARVDLSSPPPLPLQPAPPQPASVRSHPTAAVGSTRSIARHVHAPAALPIPVLPKQITPPRPVAPPPPKVSLKEQLALSLSSDPPPSASSATAAADSASSLAVPRHGRPTRTLTQTGNDIDNPISLDDDEESQQHRLHSQSAAAAPSSALYRPLDLDPQSHERAQHRVDASDWASVECLTGVEASGGGTWSWPDRSLWADLVVPKLSFEPTQIKIEWTESEDAVVPSQRLSEGSHSNHLNSNSSGSGGHAMMRSGSNVVPPSPGAHSHATHASDTAASSESSVLPEYPHGARLLIPLDSIRSLDLHRYRPYTLLIYLHDGLGVRRPLRINRVEDDGDEDLTAGGPAAAASPPPDCPAKQLRIEFDVGEALDDTTIHLILLTNASYKSLLRVFKDRADAESAAPPPFVRPQLHQPTPPRPAAASSSVAAAGSGAPYLVYPSHGKDQVSLHSSDLLCLKVGEFLNDSIVDFYLKYIYHRLLSEEVRAGVHFFNSFFYKKWCIVEEKVINSTALGVANKKRGAAAVAASSASASPSPSPSAAPSMSAEYAAVSKWAKGVDVFSKDFLVVPINESLHWSLAIICYPRKFFRKPAIAMGAATTTTGGAGNNYAAQKRKLQLSNGATAPSDVDAAAGLPSHKKPRASSDDHKSAVRCEDAIDDDVLVCERHEGAGSAASSSSSAAFPSASPPVVSAAAAASSAEPRSSKDDLCVPAVLYLDSLLPVPDQLYRRLAQYLQEEWTARYPAPHPRSQEVWSPPPYIGGLAGKPPKGSVASSAASSLSPFGSRESRVHYAADDPLYEMDVPEQKNGCDCGLFLLEYTEQFFCGNKKSAAAAANAGAGGPLALRSFIAKLRDSESAALSAPPSKATVTRNKMNASSAKFEGALKQAWKKPAVRNGYGSYGGNEDWVRGKREAIRNLIEKERREGTSQTESVQPQTNSYVQQKNSYVQMLQRQPPQQPPQQQAQTRPVFNIMQSPPPIAMRPALAAFATEAAVPFAAAAALTSASTAASAAAPLSSAAPVISLSLRAPPVCSNSLSQPDAESQAPSQSHAIDSHMTPVEDAADASDERKSGSPAESADASAEESASGGMLLSHDHAQSSSSLSLSPGLEFD